MPNGPVCRCTWKDGGDTCNEYRIQRQYFRIYPMCSLPSVDSGSVESWDHEDLINELCLGIGPDLKRAGVALKTIAECSAWCLGGCFSVKRFQRQRPSWSYLGSRSLCKLGKMWSIIRSFCLQMVPMALTDRPARQRMGAVNPWLVACYVESCFASWF